MTKIVTHQDKIATLRQLLARSERELLKALPQHIDGGRMLRVYMTAVQTTRGLADCEPVSVLGAVFQSAQFGLSLDTVLGEAFLIPRWNKARHALLAQFQLGYKGYIKLARNADSDLRDIFAHVVCKNDVFEWQLGMKPTIVRHCPPLGNRGALTAAYAVGVWKDGYERFEIVLAEEIEEIKGLSDSYQKALQDGSKDSPWITHEPAMWRKTALRRFGNRMPLSADSALVKALQQESIDGATFMQHGASINTVISADVPAQIETARSAEPPPSSPVDPMAPTEPGGADAVPTPRSPLDDAADAVEQRLANGADPSAAPQPPPVAQPAQQPERVRRARRGAARTAAPGAEPPPAPPPADATESPPAS